jgi:hypothetical protein
MTLVLLNWWPDGNKRAQRQPFRNGASVRLSVEALEDRVVPSAPAAPSDLVATMASDTQTGLTWTDNSSNENSFRITRATDTAFTQNVATFNVPANTTSFADTGLTPDTTCFYEVQAINASGSSADSDPGGARTALSGQDGWYPGIPGTTFSTTALNETVGSGYMDTGGGLYPEGSDTRPPAFEAFGDAATQNIQPLNASGQPDPVNGKIGFIAIGHSHATAMFNAFLDRAGLDPATNPQLVIVNCGVPGANAEDWATATSPRWSDANAAIAQAGLTPQQVQVVWSFQGWAGQASQRYPGQLAGLLASIARNVKSHFPNVGVMYNSSRPYDYNGDPTSLSPEPQSYLQGVAVKDMIGNQINGVSSLNYDPAQGPVVAPWESWGPYLWSDGANPRGDGLVWDPRDLNVDGTHPSASGLDKEASQLDAFLKTDPTATTWFLRTPATTVQLQAAASAVGGTVGLNGFTVQFSASAVSPGHTIEEYDWNFDDGDNVIGQNPAKTFFVPGTYSVRVTATDDAGNTATTTLTIVVNPDAPTNLTARPANAQVNLSWTAWPGATSYNIYRSTTSGGEGNTPWATGVTGTSFADTGLTNGTTYYYQVSAVIPAGETARSSEVSATPTTVVNLAFSGTAYRWYSMPYATDVTNQIAAPGLNDNDLTTDVNLGPFGCDIGTAVPGNAGAYEAAGVLWSSPQSISEVAFTNGSYGPNGDGVFDTDFRLQSSDDGSSWSVVSGWSLTPAYAYDSPDAAGVTYIFSGPAISAMGVRVVGLVHGSEAAPSSWWANATEIQAFGDAGNQPFGGTGSPPPASPSSAGSAPTSGGIPSYEGSFQFENSTRGSTWSLVVPSSFPGGAWERDTDA